MRRKFLKLGFPFKEACHCAKHGIHTGLLRSGWEFLGNDDRGHESIFGKRTDTGYIVLTVDFRNDEPSLRWSYTNTTDMKTIQRLYDLC